MEMDDDLIIIVNARADFENICRLCLHSTCALTDIFATDGEKSLVQLILCITGLAVEKGDGLPSKICNRCRHVVEQAYDLRNVVSRTQKILARTDFGNDETFSDNDFDNETYVNGSQDGSVEEGIIVEEYDGKTFDVSQVFTESIQSENGEDSITTEIPAQIKRRKNDGKRLPAWLTCQLCLVQLDTREEVRSHVETHYTDSDLQIYLDIHTRPFVCTFCDEIQLNKAQLVKHHRLHLGVNPYICKHPGCSYEGKDRDGLRHHRVVHESPCHVCAECGVAYRRRSDLLSHMTRLHPEASQRHLSNHVCACCGLRSTNELSLQIHMKAHHYAPRFPCQYGSCERAYRSQSALANHERAHRGERRYRCPLCDVAEFISTKTLKRHMMLHDRSLMSKCDKCPATFEQQAALSRHRRAHHGPWQPQRCRACNQGYQSESQLEKHMKICNRMKLLLMNGQTDSHMESVKTKLKTVLREELYLKIKDYDEPLEEY